MAASTSSYVYLFAVSVTCCNYLTSGHVCILLCSPPNHSSDSDRVSKSWSELICKHLRNNLRLLPSLTPCRSPRPSHSRLLIWPICMFLTLQVTSPVAFLIAACPIWPICMYAIQQRGDIWMEPFSPWMLTMDVFPAINIEERDCLPADQLA